MIEIMYGEPSNTTILQKKENVNPSLARLEQKIIELENKIEYQDRKIKRLEMIQRQTIRSMKHTNSDLNSLMNDRYYD